MVYCRSDIYDAGVSNNSANIYNTAGQDDTTGPNLRPRTDDCARVDYRWQIITRAPSTLQEIKPEPCIAKSYRARRKFCRQIRQISESAYNRPRAGLIRRAVAIIYENNLVP